MANEMLNDGSGTGVHLEGHMTGNPIPSLNGSAAANLTVAHTWLIVVAALVILWLFGGAIFKKIRM